MRRLFSLVLAMMLIAGICDSSGGGSGTATTVRSMRATEDGYFMEICGSSCADYQVDAESYLTCWVGARVEFKASVNVWKVSCS